MFNKLFKLFLLGFTVISLCSIGCGRQDEPPAHEFDRTAMLSNLATNIIIPNYQNYKQQTDNLKAKVELFNTNPDQPSLQAIQEAFKNTYRAWQKVSVFQFGPADSVLLRGFTNVFPTDTLQIQSNINSGLYDFNTTDNLDAQGLPAIDYLLFGVGNTNEVIVSKFSTDTQAAQRRAYLLALVTRIQEKATTVYDKWTTGYQNTFINSTGTDMGSSIGLLVNQISYDFEIIKSLKIATPVGDRTLGQALPETVEAYYSGISVELAALQTANIQHVFNGGSGLGFDDYLTFLNAKSGTGAPLAEVINSQLATVIQKLNAIPNPLSQSVITNQAVVKEALVELKKTVVYIKTDMASALGVSITYADNDGD